MAPKLRDALKLAKEAESWRSPKICEEQCSILRSALVDLAEFLKEIQQHLEEEIDWEEVCQLLRRGCELLQSCEQEEDWVLRALLYEESRADFQDLHSDVYHLVETLTEFLPGSSLEAKAGISEAGRKLLAAKRPLEDSAAVKDRKQLIKLALEKEQRNRVRSNSSSSSKKSQALAFLCTTLVERSSPDSENSHLMIEYDQIKQKKHLGGGNYGSVYDATWANYELALKVFHPGDSISFPRELSALACYKHPNILHIVGYSQNPKTQQYCLLMEKLETDLESLLEKKNSKKHLTGECPLHEKVALSIMLQIAKGMAWLHSCKVIHRDLKPQNVLLSRSRKQSWYAQAPESYFVKIADFGLARTKFVTSQVSYATPKRGTRAFCAPEVWDSDRCSYSKMSDVYSFGMVCYQILTGNIPFHNVNTLDPGFMEKVVSGLRPQWPELTSEWVVELVELVKLCWSPEPQQRPQFLEICNKLRMIKSTPRGKSS